MVLSRAGPAARPTAQDQHPPALVDERWPAPSLRKGRCPSSAQLRRRQAGNDGSPAGAPSAPGSRTSRRPSQAAWPLLPLGSNSTTFRAVAVTAGAGVRPDLDVPVLTAGRTGLSEYRRSSSVYVGTARLHGGQRKRQHSGASCRIPSSAGLSPSSTLLPWPDQRHWNDIAAGRNRSFRIE